VGGGGVRPCEAVDGLFPALEDGWSVGVHVVLVAPGPLMVWSAVRFALKATVAGDHPSKRLGPRESPVRLVGGATAAAECFTCFLCCEWYRGKCRSDPLLVGQKRAFSGKV